jgi:hypothetical protein
MAALGRVLVGFRKNDRRRLRLIDEYGLQFVGVRNCAAGCGYPVYFNASGVEALNEKDAEVICEECASLYRMEIEQEI